MTIGQMGITVFRAGAKRLFMPSMGISIVEPIGAAAPAWVPTDIPGCVLWLDASAITGLSDGDPVGTWSDLSGSLNHFTQGTTAAKPTYKTAIKNGLPIVRFDGDDWLAEAGNAASLQVTALSLFVVFSSTADAPGHYGGLARMVGENAESNMNRMLHSTLTPYVMLYQWRDSSNVNHSLTTTNGYSLNTWYVHGTTFTTGANGWNAYKDGAANGSAAGYVLDTGTTGMEIGRGAGATYQLKGDIAEYLLYNSALSDINRGLVEDYLGAKWGIAVA